MRKILIFLLWIIFWNSCSALSWQVWFDPNDEAGYFISNYEVNINITKTWILEVLEIINANLTRYRIWPVRSVPTKYKIPENNSNFWEKFGKKTFDIKLDEIRVAGIRYLPLFLKWTWNIRIWEDEDYTKWTKQYIINYNVHNAINKTSKQNELYWDIVPNNWDTKINSVKFKIKLPKDLKLDKDNSLVYWKKDGETNTLQNIEYWNNFISWNLDIQLNSWSNIWIWIIFPKDYFESDVKENFSFFVNHHIFEIIVWILILFAIITGIVVFGSKDTETEK